MQIFKVKNQLPSLDPTIGIQGPVKHREHYE